MREDLTKILYDELYLMLPTSTEAQRKDWTKRIISPEIDLKQLLVLATEKKERSSRFFWLMGDIADTYPQKLFPVLPTLFELKDNFKHDDWRRSFAKFWSLCGIPQENEAGATDLLFKWMLAPQSNVSLKRYSLLALKLLADKYPDLKNELKLCIEDQLDKTTASFTIPARKILEQLK